MKTKTVKRKEAAERQAVYDALSPKQRIALAQARPGNSKRELERLRKLIAKQSKKANLVSEEE